MPKSIPIWEVDGWIRGEKLGEGFQGRTYRARRHDRDSTAFDFVLKDLKRQTEKVHRKRFFLESQNLRVSDFDGIARLVHTNANSFADNSVELYLITEFIPGPDLSNFRDLPCDLKIACTILLRILDTVEKCHAIDVVHRDIKPCHVILRHGNVNDPVIIDFGLATNVEILPDEILTVAERGVGNRFILMPEQMDGSDKRNPRSDITQCVGLFYYLLTGTRPGLIVWPDGRKPHDRVPLPKRSAWSRNQIGILKRLLDSGFEYDVNRRWPTAKSLADQIGFLMQDKDMSSTHDFSSALDKLYARIKRDPENELALRAQELYAALNQACHENELQARNQFKEYASVGRLARAHVVGASISDKWQIRRKLTNGAVYSLSIEGRREGTQLKMRGLLTKAPSTTATQFLGQWNESPETTEVLFEEVSDTKMLAPTSSEDVLGFAAKVWVKALEIALEDI